MLLLVRVALYITASVTVSTDPQVSLLMTIVLVGGLLFVDIVNTVMYFNLLALAAFNLYNFGDITNQRAVAYISTIITFYWSGRLSFYFTD